MTPPGPAPTPMTSPGARERSLRRISAPGPVPGVSPIPGSHRDAPDSPRARRFPVERADGRCAFDWKPTRSRKNGSRRMTGRGRRTGRRMRALPAGPGQRRGPLGSCAHAAPREGAVVWKKVAPACFYGCSTAPYSRRTALLRHFGTGGRRGGRSKARASHLFESSVRSSPVRPPGSSSVSVRRRRIPRLARARARWEWATQGSRLAQYARPRPPGVGRGNHHHAKGLTPEERTERGRGDAVEESEAPPQGGGRARG